MVWTIPDQTFDGVIAEIEKQTDRGAALIAVSLVEAQLTSLITSRLQENKNLQNKLFKPSGPIGDFGTKIDLGVLLGFYPEAFANQIHTLRKIRNLFAHQVRAIDFESRDPKSLCDDLLASSDLAEFIENEVLDNIASVDMPTNTPREKFYFSCKWLLFYLGLMVTISQMYEPETLQETLHERILRQKKT